MTRAPAAALCLALLSAAAVRLGAAAPAPSVVVFVTSSYDQEYEFPLLNTFLSRWREREPLVSLFHYPLAPTAYTMSAEASRLSVEAIAARLGGKAPTLILAQGDPAFFLSLELRRSQFPGAPMIAFDVLGNEARRKQYEADKSLYIVVNTGVEELNAAFGARIFPKRDRIVALIRVGNEAGHADEVKRSVEAAAPGCQVVMVLNPGTQEKADPFLKQSPERSFVLNLSPGWVDSKGNYLTGKDHVRCISDTYGVPVVEHFRTMLGGGIVGGVGLSPVRWGGTAADMALGLLFDGREPEHWMRISNFATAFADYRELERFGSSPKLLPPGAELINEPLSLWIRFQPFLQALLAVLVLAVAYFAFRAFVKRRESSFLVAANARLEKEVAERTRELRASNEELAASNSSLTEAMRRTEEMQEAVLRSAREITLGRFSAGMANGINSQLGAVRASNAALRSISSEGGGGLHERLLALDAGQRELFLRYARRVVSRSDYLSEGSAETLEGLDRRLEGLAGEGLRDVAEDLADAGLAGLGDEELKLFSGEKGREVAHALYRLSIIDRSTWIIDEAVERAAETIKAVRDYATDAGGGDAGGKADLRVTIERALLILKGRLPRSVVLKAEYDNLPPVRGSEATFVRIWASLVQNALQAMPGGGRLDVSLRREGRWAVVSVSDEGVGIDPSIEGKLFEPFVTTRPVAEGMGLGLAYCKRSVEAAGGSIGYARREKGTEFYVRLPLPPDS